MTDKLEVLVTSAEGIIFGKCRPIKHNLVVCKQPYRLNTLIFMANN